MATGLVMRNTATASGRTRPAEVWGTPSQSRARSIITGRLASDDWVETATTWAGAAAAREPGQRYPPPDDGDDIGDQDQTDLAQAETMAT